MTRRLAVIASALLLLSGLGADRPSGPETRANAPLSDGVAETAAPQPSPAPDRPLLGSEDVRQSLSRTAPSMVLFALASLVPAGVLMTTAFVRISIVLTLLRQAL